MNRALFAAVAAVGLLACSVASANVVADFQLNGNTTNAAAGGVTLTDNTAGGLGASGITFDAQEGPTLNNLGVINVYSLKIRATLNTVNGYRKIADFKDRTSDNGFYVQDGDIEFYPFVYGPAGVLSAGNPFVVTLTRDSDKRVTGYFNGVSQFSFIDNGDDAVIDGTLHLFRDDFAFQGEASAGFIDYVTIDSNPGAVPEPAAWALMLAGFGGVGAMVRRRRAVPA